MLFTKRRYLQTLRMYSNPKWVVRVRPFGAHSHNLQPIEALSSTEIVMKVAQSATFITISGV